jgi:hypothetical protein
MEEVDPNILQGRHAPRHALLPRAIPVGQRMDVSGIEEKPPSSVCLLLLLLLLLSTAPLSRSSLAHRYALEFRLCLVSV